jgi:hypothetical protein
MNALMQLTPEQLRKAADIQEHIESLKKELGQILGAGAAPSASTVEAPAIANKPKKRFSVRTRAKMAAAQKARWAAKRGEVPKRAEKSNKQKVSEARLKALAKAREARWAKVRAAKKAK